MVQPLCKTVQWFLTKLKVLLQNATATVPIGICPKELKAYVHTKNMSMDIYSSFIHNWQNFEATKMPFSKWMNK